jgi:uncharacterized protein YbaR (Trm112 family)
MRKELLSILACPVCKGKIELQIEKENGDEILTGSLYCPRCKVNYPISDAIPNLLTPEQRNN